MKSFGRHIRGKGFSNAQGNRVLQNNAISAWAYQI